MLSQRLLSNPLLVRQDTDSKLKKTMGAVALVPPSRTEFVRNQESAVGDSYKERITLSVLPVDNL